MFKNISSREEAGAYFALGKENGSRTLIMDTKGVKCGLHQLFPSHKVEKIANANIHLKSSSCSLAIIKMELGLHFISYGGYQQH